MRLLYAERFSRIRDKRRGEGLRDEQSGKLRDQAKQALAIRLRTSRLIPDHRAISLGKGRQACRRQRCAQARVDPEDSSDGYLGDYAIEAEADAFAGAFLLPSASLRDDIAQFGMSVSFLAERYAVSGATVRRRLKTLEVVAS